MSVMLRQGAQNPRKEGEHQDDDGEDKAGGEAPDDESQPTRDT